MDMKKLLNIVSGNVEKKQINESIVECGMPMQTQSAIPTVTPVSMSVNLNAQGIDQIKDLLNLMNKAESPLAPGLVGGGAVVPDPIDMLKAPMAPMADKQTAQGPGLDDLANELGMDLEKEEGQDDEMEFDMGPEEMGGDDTSGQKSPLGKMADEVRDMADELADVNDEEENESYANSPDEKISPYQDPAGNDLHKRKASYSDKPFRGDNPMAVENLKSDLAKLYKQIKEIR
jgi:hypothetical protein